MERIKNFFKDESGASAVEYGLLVSWIALVIIIVGWLVRWAPSLIAILREPRRDSPAPVKTV